MILLIDNYDSFTYNLVQYLGANCGRNQSIPRDEVSLPQVEKMKPTKIVISWSQRPPGGRIANEVIAHFPSIPTLGCVFGHQCIAYVEGKNSKSSPTLPREKVFSSPFPLSSFPRIASPDLGG